MPVPTPDRFTLDRTRFTTWLEQQRLDVTGIDCDHPRGLSAGVASFFWNALDAGAILCAPGLQPAVYDVGGDFLIVAVRGVNTHGALIKDGRQTSTLAFDVSEVMSVRTNGFHPACDVLDALLRRADGVLPAFRAMRDGERVPAAHYPIAALMINPDKDGSDEIAIPFPYGRTLRTNYGWKDVIWIGADYLRVCQPDGTEIASWEQDEWQMDPVVIAAVLACALGLPGLEDPPQG